MEVKETVIQIIAEQALLDPSDITLDSSMEDLEKVRRRRPRKT